MELLERMKGEIVHKFETKFEEQNNKTINLKSRIAAQENIIKKPRDKMRWQRTIQPAILSLYSWH